MIIKIFLTVAAKIFLMKVQKRKIYKIRNIKRKNENLPVLFNQVCGTKVKPLEEWIYGKLNRVGSSGIINFKNQTAFRGYDGRNIHLCKEIISYYIL